jgi:2,4-dienoyl-CoA reductase-like NADH-dependent reductase (Old Yellow Enzyme family)
MTKQFFHYQSLDDVKKDLDSLQCSLPLSTDTGILNTPFTIGTRLIPNRMGIAPMEGVDSAPNGAPTDWTQQRYIRYAEGGAGLIWFEAISIVQEGRSSLKQLLLNQKTLPEYQRLIEKTKETGLKANGFEPYLVMQANHSGRYSRPNPQTKPEPIIAFNNPELETGHPLDSVCIASDDYLERLEEKFGEAAELCKKAGFDAIDIKACHGYLLGELTAAYTRPGRYGGSFENRMRLLVNAVRNAINAQSKKFTVLSRIGIYDGLPYPYGFGMIQDGNLTPDYSEPLRLIGILHKELGMPFINITMGDPHVYSHVTRPFNQDRYIPPENPLQSVARMYTGSAVVKKANPDLLVSLSAPSYLRQFAPNLAAGAIAEKVGDHVLFGRLSFANPSFPNDIIKNGTLDKKRTCLTCSKCSVLLRSGEKTGCVIREPDPYLIYYRAVSSPVETGNSN